MILLRTRMQLFALLACSALAVAGQAPLNKQIEGQTAQVRGRRAAIDSVREDRKKAQLWLELNRAADRLAGLISKKPVKRTPEGPPDVVPAPDVVIRYCEIGNVWAAVTTGYQNYLKLWPDGPDADEAFWKTKVEPSGCGDFEGTEEEYREGIKRYETFLENYPNSRFATQAQSQLKIYREGLEELLPGKRRSRRTAMVLGCAAASAGRPDAFRLAVAGWPQPRAILCGLSSGADGAGRVGKSPAIGVLRAPSSSGGIYR